MKTSVLLSWEVPDSYKSAVPFQEVRWGRPARHTQSRCGAHVAVPAHASAFTKPCPAGLGGPLT